MSEEPETMIYCIGTPVLDVLFKQKRANKSNVAGAILNTTMSLQRLNSRVRFCTAIGKDLVGNMAVEFFQDNKCNTDYVVQYEELQSLVALVFLDENNRESYTFYGDFKPDLVVLPKKVTHKDIICIGDFISLFPSYNNILQRLPKEPIIYYDPNIRSPMDGEAYSQFMNNIWRSNIVRFSNDDVEMINRKINIIEYIKKIDHIFLVIITYNDKAVYILDGKQHEFSFPLIKPSNPVGAGDNFNAGFLHLFQYYELYQENIIENQDKLVHCIKYGIELAKRICMSDNSYLDEDFTLE